MQGMERYIITQQTGTTQTWDLVVAVVITPLLSSPLLSNTELIKRLHHLEKWGTLKLIEEQLNHLYYLVTTHHVTQKGLN